jgi:hypothetical protein
LENSKNVRPRIVRDYFGPEVTFGYMLKHSIFPDDGIYLVKHAIGGSISIRISNGSFIVLSDKYR